MAAMLQLKYDELRIIVKGLKDGGEDITMLHTKTRERVHDLYGQWMGDAADKFFEEMEIKYLPSLQRTAQALFFAQDVLLRIIKLIDEADHETAGYFRRDLDQFGSFGASGIGTGSGGTTNETGTPVPGAGDTTQQGGGPTGAGDTGSSGQSGGDSQQGQTDTSAGSGAQNAGQGTGGGGGSSGASGGGGSFGGGGSHSSTSSSGGASSAGGSSSGSQAMPDHIYGNGGSAGSSGGSGSASSGSTGGGEQGSAESGAAVAAAVVGVGGAAIGGAVKATRGRKK